MEEALGVALRFLWSLQGRNMIVDPKRYIVKSEGISYDQFIEQLVIAALSSTDPMEGLVAYWKEVLYPVYGTHKTRTVNIDTTLAELEGDHPSKPLGLRGSAFRGPSPSKSLAPSRVAETASVGPNDNKLYRTQYGQRNMWPEERKEIIRTWLDTGSATETAQLLRLPYKKVANATERVGSLLYQRAAREGLIDLQGEPTEEMRRCCQALVEFLQTE